jgi:Domain of unknown function (DUF4440)
MKRVLTIIVLIVAACAVVCAQTNAQHAPRDNRVVEEIKRLDRLWIIEAYSSKDLKDFDRIVAADFLITGSNGKILNKAEKRANVVADYTEPAPDAIFKIADESTQVRVFDKTAISTGYIIENYTYKGNKINDRVYFTNTYLNRDGHWQVVASHFTRIKQSAAPTLAALPAPTPSDLTSASDSELQQHLGERVQMRGRFSLRGKVGPFILVGGRPIYLVPTGAFSWGEAYARMEGKDVHVTGTLRFAHYPTPTPEALPEGRPSDHFYFEAETAQIELSQR